VSTDARRPAVVVANLSAPEINRLGIELARRGVLRKYVRPYVNRRRWWERLIEHTPGIGKLYAGTLGRRTPPDGMPLNAIVEAGIAQDFAGAAVGRLPLLRREWRRHTAHGLILAAERAVARKAGELAAGADLAVASYGTGQYAFEAIRRGGGRAVLSYPIAHNRYQARLYAEEAERAPEFAAALPRIDLLPAEYSARLDRECELADRIIVGSSFVRQSFIESGYDARKIAVTPYGVDTERFMPRTGPRDDGTFRLLFVGQIGQRKGMSYLLKAYELFRKSDSELHLVGTFSGGREVYDRYTPL